MNQIEKVRENLKAILGRGLCAGIGKREACMCIEASIAEACGDNEFLPDEEPTDSPSIVAEDLRSFSIELNDARWSSNEARAKGLEAWAMAQLFTNTSRFTERAETWCAATLLRIVRELVPIVLEAHGLDWNGEGYAHAENLAIVGDAAADLAWSVESAGRGQLYRWLLNLREACCECMNGESIGRVVDGAADLLWAADESNQDKIDRLLEHAARIATEELQKVLAN